MCELSDGGEGFWYSAKFSRVCASVEVGGEVIDRFEKSLGAVVAG